MQAAPMPMMPGYVGQGVEVVEEEPTEITMQTEGTPWMEVWVQHNEDGTFNRQTTLLRPPMGDLPVLQVRTPVLLIYTCCRPLVTAIFTSASREVEFSGEVSGPDLLPIRLVEVPAASTVL